MRAGRSDAFKRNRVVGTDERIACDESSGLELESAQRIASECCSESVVVPDSTVTSLRERE